MFLTLLVVDLIVLLFRFVYIFITPFDLAPEEAQYWDWSRHLDLSYYSKPPLIAYLNWLSTHIFGNTEFAVRFWPAVFGFLSSLLIYRFAALFFKDKKLAFWLALLPNVLVGFNALSFVFTTDTPLFFFWGLSLYLLWRAVETEKTFYWFFLGISGGLGFLAKYSMALFFPLGVVYILFRKPHLFKTHKPYLSTFIGLLFTLPVIYWNYVHDWVSFKHVLNLSGVERKYPIPNWKTFFNFLISQMALLGFGFFFYLIWGWLKNFTPKRKGFIFTLFSFYPYLIFQLLALKKSVYGNWAGFAYFSGGMLAGYYYVKSFKRLLPLSVSVLVLSLFLTAVAFYPPLLDRLGMTKLLPPKKDPTRVMIGWEKLGKSVSNFYDPKRDFIFSNLYQISAEMAFYVKGNPQTYVFNYYQRMNQYDLWEVKDFSLFEKWLEGENIPPQRVFNWKPLKGKNGIFITPLRGVPKVIRNSFERVVWKKVFPVKWRGETVRIYYIFYLKGFKGNFAPIIRGY